MDLLSEIKIVSQKIGFIDRYKKMSEKYSFNLHESFERYNNNEVMKIFSELGYKFSYNKRENFFTIFNEEDSYKYEFKISLKYGALDFMWDVCKNEKWISSPWDVLKKVLDGKDDDKVRSPIFRNYDDLKEILKEAFLMYEDFKSEFLKIENSDM